MKGTAYLARVKLLQAKIGEGETEAFLARYRQTHPSFPTSVLPSSRIEMGTFLHLVDAIVDEIFDGDADSLWEIGEQSAEFTLTEGPYRALREGKDVERFVALAPAMYANFFDTGRAATTVESGTIRLIIDGIPKQFHHRYFEYSVVGYFRRGIELMGINLQCHRERGFSAGDEDVCYTLTPVD
ncbi:MAG: hypothetical protein AAFX94_23820 [Myxococcota bacterium]